MDEYNDEFIITLADIEGAEIWCEPFKRDTGYFTDESIIAYVFDNCNSKCLDNIKSSIVYEVSVNSEDDECNCDNCYDDNSLYTNTSNGESTYISKTEDGKVAGFSKTWTTTKDNVTCTSSYSHYSTDEDIVKKIARDFGIEI